MPGEDYEEEEEQMPLLQTSALKLTGNVWTALAHLIAGVIGSGVLSMAWSMAQLGWIAGPLSIILIAFFSLVSAFLISNIQLCSNHPSITINRSYLQAVHTILGYKNGLICGCLVYFSLFKTGVVYVITSGICMRAIRQSNCYHEEGHEGDCEYKNEYYMVAFGIVEILASQIPNIFHTKWISIIAAAMSLTYSCIGIGLGIAQVIGQGRIEGSMNGISTSNPSQKVWLVGEAIGDISFSFTYSLILLEIQSTLKSPPPQKETMKKVSTIGVLITASLYICCGASGYAAFGDSTPGNLLTGFGFYEPYWLVDFGNACIVLHLVGGYQIYSQTLFAIVEGWYAEKFQIITREMDVGIGSLRVNPFRLCFRTTYVVLTTTVAILFPYFNQVLAFSGSIIFWPLTIYFPVEMYFLHNRILPWTTTWILLRIYTIFCMLLTIFTFAASLQGLVSKRFVFK
ncbi:probable amino acid permease 7 [Lactuca sativa]|uniref:probable amino acid permease 7 n=1 Tax=Lactuca sativa TaxID=4236 RepID=UPI000CD7F9C6|nr:probable amino acid permease 7 [Lactuca sativa]